MRTIELIDVEVPLPDDAVVEIKREGKPGPILYGVASNSLDLVRDRIEVGAILRGFELKRTSDGSYLARRGQGIDLIWTGPSQAVIRVDDPECLPDARVCGRGVALGPLAIDVQANRILPGKERHDEETHAWEATWQLDGAPAAEEVSTSIHRQLAARSPTSSGLWPPLRPGAARWRIEAELTTMRVQVYVLEGGAGLRLDVFVVDRCPGAAGAP